MKCIVTKIMTPWPRILLVPERHDHNEARLKSGSAMICAVLGKLTDEAHLGKAACAGGHREN